MDSMLIGNNASFGGGLDFYSCKVFEKNVLFLNNMAEINAGGIFLEKSEIWLIGNISFIANKVTSEIRRGGALFSYDIGNNCGEYSCPVLWTNHSKLTFVNNNAKERPILFGGKLNLCNKLPEKSLKKLSKDWNSLTCPITGVHMLS